MTDGLACDVPGAAIKQELEQQSEKFAKIASDFKQSVDKSFGSISESVRGPAEKRFRRIELVGLTWDCVTWLDSGIEILLRSSKVDQAGAGFVKFIPNACGDRCPVKALRHWQEISGLTDGPIFRSVGQNESIGERALSTHAVAKIIMQLIESSGRDPALFSGHSLRAAFVTRTPRPSTDRSGQHRSCDTNLDADKDASVHGVDVYLTRPLGWGALPIPIALHSSRYW